MFRKTNVSFSSIIDEDFSLTSNVNLYTAINKRKKRQLMTEADGVLFNMKNKRNRMVFSIDAENDRLFYERHEEMLRLQEKELKVYLKQLEFRRLDNSYLSEELHRAARDNEFNKIRTLCSFLVSNGHSLVEDAFLGEKYRESALIVAIVKGSTESAIVLVDFGGTELLSKHYTTKQYAEVLPLHLAIIKQNPVIVDYMLSALDDATKLEMINSQARSKGIHDACICPWIPIALAVSVGSVTIVEVLLEKGANLLIRDEATGNTVLHILANVAVRAPDVAKKTLYRVLNSAVVKSWWQMNQYDSADNLASSFLRMTNKAGMTPMAYAVSQGATEFAAAILDLDQVYTFPQWYLGPNKACLYDVSEIDPAASTNSVGVSSVLEMYAYVKSERALAFGKKPHMYHVMENKFRAYRHWFVAFFIYHSLVMLCFTIVCAHFTVPPVFASLLWKETNTSLRSGLIESPYSADPFTDKKNLPNWKLYTIQLLEIFVFFSAALYFILDLAAAISTILRCLSHSQCRRCSWKFIKSSISSRCHDALDVALLIFSVSVISLFVMRLYRSQFQDLLYSLALVTGWSFMLFFIRAVKDIGIFTAIMHRIVVRELSYFLVLFLIGTVACGTAMYMLFSMTAMQRPQEVNSVIQTFFTLFKVLVGLDELDVLENVGRSWAAKILFVVFVLFCHILLLNMLIAAMNDRYIRLAEMRKVLWLQSRTKAVLFLERHLPPCLRPDHGFEKLERRNNNDLWVLAREEANSEHPLTNFGFDDDVLSLR